MKIKWILIGVLSEIILAVFIICVIPFKPKSRKKEIHTEDFSFVNTDKVIDTIYNSWGLYVSKETLYKSLQKEFEKTKQFCESGEKE